MANKKINELTALSELTDNKLVAIGDPGTGVLYKYSVGALKTALKLTDSTRNRFQEIFFVDADDNVIIKETTDFIGLKQFFSPTGELLFQIGPAVAAPVNPGDPTPPEPVDLDIAWTLSENEPNFLDLNLVFRDATNGVLSDHYNEGSGLVGDGGGVKPKARQLMRAEVTYDGGVGIVPVWDGPTKVTLEVRKNGVLFDKFLAQYATPPAAGSLGLVYFQPTEFHTWTVDAKIERYTVDTTGSVDSPPEIVITKSLVGGTETITGGFANVKLYSDQSSDPDGDILTREWIFPDADAVITAI